MVKHQRAWQQPFISNQVLAQKATGWFTRQGIVIHLTAGKRVVGS
ncbi:MAG: hypothetical protein ONB48_11435 [candidate division KSB1 bacterium]|nr:hypothetical protein [candidate division KSB1 bacterium]MDZ7286254.1 hypothetical protein [candidate division KSB1 bacterium]MDZ7296480.1 hypothetical protein [candidate division KSB1 bacterium]MDZ7305561.1 hypothetical protein [candidate division KSB1 bacterium]MDZ7347347.1 hypothetical protein [candidate division KSB1 bacterium]